MSKPEPGTIHGRQRRAIATNTGILDRSRQLLRDAGALIVRCLKQTGNKRPWRDGDDRGPRRSPDGERRRQSGEVRPARGWAVHGRRATPRRHTITRPRSARAGAEHVTVDMSAPAQPSEATIAQLLRRRAFRIAHGADPVDALAGVIDLVIESSADPYHLIGVLAEGAVQVVNQRIPTERRRDTAMALAQLMLDRLQFGRME